MPKAKSNPKLLEAEGYYKKNPDRRIECVTATEGRPAVPDTVGECPLTLEIWNETLDHLESMGILTYSDEHLLVEYCSTYAEFLKLTKLVREHGHFYTDEKGNHRPHPASTAWDRTKASLLKLQAQLGLTPSARAGMTMPKKEDGPSEAEALMGEFGL